MSTTDVHPETKKNSLKYFHNHYIGLELRLLLFVVFYCLHVIYFIQMIYAVKLFYYFASRKVQ